MSAQLTLSSYNASVFKIIKKYSYRVTIMDLESNAYREFRRKTPFVTLQATEWSSIYADTYVSKYGNLVLGVDSFAWNTSLNPSGSLFSIDSYLPRNISGDVFPDCTGVSGEGWAPFWWLNRGVNATLPSRMHISEGFITNFGRESRVQVNLYW